VKRRVLSLAVVLGLGLTSLASAPAASGSHTSVASSGAVAAKEYRNPVLDRDFPDPDVIEAANGWYYAYSTESDPGGRHVNIQVARSRDLISWRYLGDALPRLPKWGDKTGVSWAPDVARRGGSYFLYYSIVPNRLANDFGLCLAVATSRSPAGPFQTTGKPLYCGPTISDIDSHVFRDPKTGMWWVYWGSGGDIVTARLASNMISLVRPHAQPKLLLRGWSAKVRRPYEHGIEGPFVITRHGWYYLFYSGNNCCSYPPHYATMVARSRHATGPFQRLAATRPGLSSVILHGNDRWAGPGHNSVIRDDAGHDWMFYHAIDNRHPYLPGGNQYVRRVMLMDRIVYRNGWPTLVRSSPSVSWKPGPVTR
jgi:arabinan endo-1,5-alpha-L-arabinosidase